MKRGFLPALGITALLGALALGLRSTGSGQNTEIAFLWETEAKTSPDADGAAARIIEKDTRALLLEKPVNGQAAVLVDGQVLYVQAGSFGPAGEQPSPALEPAKEPVAASSAPADEPQGGSDSQPPDSAQEQNAQAWEGQPLTRDAGSIEGPEGTETWYNLNMDGVISIMRKEGNNDPYWVREDGVKMLGDYVMVGADFNVHPRGSLVQTSLGTGIVCDTGYLAPGDSDHIDIAVTWQ
ncbi:MAG: hypothetical protein HUJ54_06580 [Erysipelotrichaceae bacterium]|nr:hypothetical protein [Erysipelotrichaceae bacterium]